LFSRFIIRTGKHGYVRQYILLILLGIVFFVLPLQVFIIGDFAGIGIQGAVYRYQISGYGVSLIPITRDLTFVVSGIYTGKTALSNILWALGTVLLTVTTLYAFIRVRKTSQHYYRQISYGLIASSIIYLASCIAQYGFFFNGPAGISLPAGVFFILFWVTIINKYPDIFFGKH
jgi:hypothetical protein